MKEVRHSQLLKRYNDACSKAVSSGRSGEELQLRQQLHAVEATTTGIEQLIAQHTAAIKQATDPAYNKALRVYEKELAAAKEQEKRAGERVEELAAELRKASAELAVISARALGLGLNPPR